jgi:putative ABC transport system substrate-binding protein
MVAAFRKGLNEAGYAAHHNVAIEYRWAEEQPDQLPLLVADLVQRQVAVIVATGGNNPAIVAKAATSTIPIVFIAADYPVRVGLVVSLARPGGNLIGINFLNAELTAKRLELLHELVPAAKRIAVLVAPTGAATEATLRDIDLAARAMGLQIQIINTSNSREIDAAFATFAHERPDALFVSPDPFFRSRRMQVIHLATRLAIPATYALRDYAEAGGLMSYGEPDRCVSPSRHLYRAYPQRARSPQTCRSYRRASSSSSSTLKLRGHSASPCRRRCSPSPMR